VPLRLLLRSVFRRRRVEQDLDDELSFHLAMEASRRAAAVSRTPTPMARAVRSAAISR
jgi:hypothetical protein